jgi:hypothetical protein
MSRDGCGCCECCLARRAAVPLDREVLNGYSATSVLQDRSCPVDRSGRPSRNSVRILHEGLPALHRKPGRPCQPADRRRPRRRHQQPMVVTVRARKRFCAPSPPPRRCPLYVREPVPGPAHLQHGGQHEQGHRTVTVTVTTVAGRATKAGLVVTAARRSLAWAG